MPKRSREVPEGYLQYKHELARAIGNRIRQRRAGLGLTQEALRARLELNAVPVTRSRFSRIENGLMLPDAAEVIALAMVLDVSCQWILLSRDERS